MREAVYNSAIPENLWRSVNCASRSASAFPALPLILFAALACSIPAQAADWNAAEQQLARKIVAVTGPGAIVLTVENRSSLGRRDGDIVTNGLRVALEQSGIHFVKSDQAVGTVAITLSENPTSYVWVAEIHQGTASSVVMVSVPRSGRPNVAHDSMPITLRKSLIWGQDGPMLDVAVLEENGAPTRIAVLTPDNVSIYRLQNGKWQTEQTVEVIHAGRWPLDLRGRLVPAKDHLLDAYLPGVICRTAPGSALTMNCHESDDPWPMVSIGANTGSPIFPTAGSANKNSAPPVPQMSGFFAPARNFFTGVITPAIGKFSTVPKFYSAGFLPREKYTLWLFAATDGRVHLVDGVSDQASRFEWGSDIATVRTSCGAGWQVLAADSGMRNVDSVRAYEFPDRDAVAVSAAIDLTGPISAMWTEARGDTAIVVVKNRETGGYEAYRLEVACSQ